MCIHVIFSGLPTSEAIESADDKLRPVLLNQRGKTTNSNITGTSLSDDACPYFLCTCAIHEKGILCIVHVSFDHDELWKLQMIP